MPTVSKKLKTKFDLNFLIEQKPYLEKRARLFSFLRAFFTARGYLEIDTPLAVLNIAPEPYIESPSTSHGYFLRTSPELQMKMLLAAHYTHLFQIGSCFREGENGKRHKEEFTMLEWYTAHQTYAELQAFTSEIILEAGHLFGLNWTQVEVISVHDAFKIYAQIDVEKAIEIGEFESLLCEKIEPNLGRDNPTCLIDYPISQAAFAQQSATKPHCAERFELYVNGIELANGYGELIDPVIQRERFEAFDCIRRQNGGKPYPVPDGFLESIDYGLPPSAGCAMGLDRLLMVLLNLSDIKYVKFLEY